MIGSLLLMSSLPARALPAEEIDWGALITDLVIAFLFLVCVFLLRRRFLKIICACGAEVCLFLACKTFFGPDSIITKFLCWITAAAVCIITISIVNRINWSNLWGKEQK